MAPPILNNLYQLIPQFTGSDNAVGALPYLLPPNFTYGKEQVLRVSNVNGKAAAVGNNSCVITASATGSSSSPVNSDFSLTWLAGPGTPPAAGSAPAGFFESYLIAQVNIKPDNIWKTGSAARQQLKTSFAVFYSQLEALELTGNCLAPGGAFTIAQRVVEAMPLSLDELLYYRYSFNSQNRYVDIQPGMRLRVEYAASQFISPTTPAAQLNGYVGNGSSYYDVSRATDASGAQRIAFNEFLVAMAASTTSQDTGGAGGLIDLQAAGNSRRYCRLFYPPQLTSSANTGNAGISQNVTLVGADSLSDLNKATTTYLASANTAASDGARPLLYTFFRGRTIVIPEILIQVNGQPIYVPLGTTVRNLIDRYTNLGLIIRSINPAAGDSSIIYKRQWTKNADYTRYYQIQFLPLAKDQFPATPDVYDLPVVKGDLLNFGANLS